jgi:single stranded DNA-binding protein
LVVDEPAKLNCALGPYSNWSGALIRSKPWLLNRAQWPCFESLSKERDWTYDSLAGQRGHLRVDDAQDLLAWVLGLIGKTPEDWREKDWDRVYFIRRLVTRIGQIKGWPWVNDYCGLLLTLHMANFNVVFLIGNLTRDPELRYTPKGTPVADLGLAVSRVYSTEGGEKKEDVTFLDVTLWARLAEVAHQYLHKGSPVFIEGRIQMDSWTDKQTGEKRNRLKIVGENMQLLGSREESPQKAPQPPRPVGVREPDPDPRRALLEISLRYLCFCRAFPAQFKAPGSGASREKCLALFS